MNIMMISFDPALIQDGEARRRHSLYAERAGRLTVIVPASGSRIAVSPGFSVIPTNSRSRLLFPLDAYRLALEQAQAQPVDLIITQDMFLTGVVGVWLRHKLRIPLLVQNHSYIFGNRAWLAEHPLRNRLLHSLARFVIRRADMVRTVNRKERDNAIAMGIPAERVASLPLGTASEQFAQPVPAETLSALRTKLHLAPEHRIVLWVGYPVAFKRVPLLFKVFRRVADQEPQARLLLVGDTSRSPQNLDAAAQAEGIRERVIMTGAVPHDQLPAYYALAHVYAHTSSYEGVPRVLFEASAAGLPLVGMNVVGVDEVIVNNDNGFLVPDGEVEAMAGSIVALLRDPERSRGFGDAARHLALERYSAEAYPAKWVEIWQNAVELGLRR